MTYNISSSLTRPRVEQFSSNQQKEDCAETAQPSSKSRKRSRGNSSASSKLRPQWSLEETNLLKQILCNSLKRKVDFITESLPSRTWAWNEIKLLYNQSILELNRSREGETPYTERMGEVLSHHYRNTILKQQQGIRPEHFSPIINTIREAYIEKKRHSSELVYNRLKDVGISCYTPNQISNLYYQARTSLLKKKINQNPSIESVLQKIEERFSNQITQETFASFQKTISTNELELEQVVQKSSKKIKKSSSTDFSGSAQQLISIESPPISSELQPFSIDNFPPFDYFPPFDSSPHSNHPLSPANSPRIDHSASPHTDHSSFLDDSPEQFYAQFPSLAESSLMKRTDEQVFDQPALLTDE